jgi:glycerol-3-phosphate cytidylyltransferase
MYRLGYVPGAFDLLHRGHLNLLRRARAQCDTLVIGVVSDDGVAAYKRWPVQDQGTRLEVMRQLRMVDLVVLQPTTDPTPILDAIRPDALFHGDDWDRLREGHETLALLGVDFVRLPYTRGVSSTGLITRMAEMVVA